jgi:hypothetical protein
VYFSMKVLAVLVLISCTLIKSCCGYLQASVPRLPRVQVKRYSAAADRLESIKVAVISSVAGSLVYLPIALFTGVSYGFSPQWEFNSDVLALELALFGITYRYTVREDANEMLKMGAIGAFSLTRALSAIDVPSYCTSIPLNCGPPFGYADFSMLVAGGGSFIESFVCYSASSLAIEKCFENGVIKRKESSEEIV